MDWLVFNSEHVRSEPRDRRYASKSHVVYNPLMYRHAVAERADQRSEDAAGLRLLSVVNFGWLKKVRPLGEAIAGWIDAEFMVGNDITWTICGVRDDTEAYDWFVGKVNGAEHGGCVRFIGYQKDMAAQYAAHDVLAHLSGFDAFPNAVLEASYYELPTITNPESGGTLEAVVDGVTGRVVKDGTAFKDAVLAYLKSPELRQAHGRDARAHVLEHFSIESQRAAMVALLREHFG